MSSEHAKTTIYRMFPRLWSEISLFHKLIYHMIVPFIKPFHKFSNMTYVTYHFLLQFRAPLPVTS